MYLAGLNIRPAFHSIGVYVERRHKGEVICMILSLSAEELLAFQLEWL